MNNDLDKKYDDLIAELTKQSAEVASQIKGMDTLIATKAFFDEQIAIAKKAKKGLEDPAGSKKAAANVEAVKKSRARKKQPQ